MAAQLSPEDELFLYETFKKLTKQNLEKNAGMLLGEDDDIPLSEFFLFDEKDIADCPSPIDSIVSYSDVDSPQPAFFPANFPEQTCNASPCGSPGPIFPPLQLDTAFMQCSPSPSLSPTSPTPPSTAYPSPSPSLGLRDYFSRTTYQSPPPPAAADLGRVHFIDIKDMYEKTQVRKGGISEQRLVNCRVHMFASFTRPPLDIEVYVHRYPETKNFEDKMKFSVMMEKRLPNVQYFSINLDSVYRTSLGNKFYQLSTTDRFKKNRFMISVTLVFADQSKATFTSDPFLVRSRKQSPNPRKLRSCCK